MSASLRVPLSSLIGLCRALRHHLKAGLTIVDVFRQQSRKGPPGVRALAQAVTNELESGEALEDALKKHGAGLPPLFVALASVGEHSGNLPEIFHELEKYFQLQQKLINQFRAQIAWPILQLIAAVFVLAAIPLILGMLGSPYDPLGLGLSGVAGALTILGVCFGTLGLIVATIWLLPRLLGRQAAFDRMLLTLPVVGPCLQAFALYRLCLALRLTLETGMSTVGAVKLALRATDHEAYVATTPAVVGCIKRGDDLTSSLAVSGLLPDDFQHVLSNGEESGTLTEVLEHQGEFYEEEARRKLTAMTAVAAWGVWAMVAILFVVVILRMMMAYLAEIDKLTSF